MAEGTCKLTGKLGELRKAHLYPKSFYRIRQDAPLRAISSNTDERPKPAIIGTYDPNLIIAETENWFATLDDHAAKVLKQPVKDESLLRWNGKIYYGNDKIPLGYELKDYDPNLLKLFFMSVLWRFGASERPEARAVNLGPHLERIASHLRNREAPKDHIYSVVGARFIDEEHVAIVTPTRYRLDGVNTWHMVFGAYEFLIKTDDRPFPSPWNGLYLNDQASMPIILRKFRGSKLWNRLATQVKSMHAKYGDPWGGRYVTQ
ncbi:hypothetical protein [Oceanicaulis sp.]|uniref:hypothetical protein n=1 Tax=Oceanicaulis sp. TaxID=1924941 RepID=UPI003F7217CD